MLNASPHLWRDKGPASVSGFMLPASTEVNCSLVPFHLQSGHIIRGPSRADKRYPTDIYQSLPTAVIAAPSPFNSPWKMCNDISVGNLARGVPLSYSCCLDECVFSHSFVDGGSLLSEKARLLPRVVKETLSLVTIRFLFVYFLMPH